MWMKSKWVYLRHFKIQFWHISCYLEIARIHGATLLLGSVRVQAVWQSSSFLATGPPISQDSSFPPDSTGCWTGSRRTAHGRERPSDTNQRHWRGNCNVREGIWQVKPGINQALQTISLCMAVLYFQSFAVQLMSLKKERTSAQNSVNEKKKKGQSCGEKLELYFHNAGLSQKSQAWVSVKCNTTHLRGTLPSSSQPFPFSSFAVAWNLLP